MSDIHDLQSWLANRLPELLEAHRVPAVGVAVSVGRDIVSHSVGVLSTTTGVEATADAIFQIGSITKVWTATLVMQLVDERLLELDVPVRTYLPRFRVADESASATITVRHLLSHTSGFEGDIFTDPGKGDDCMEKYVASLADVPQLFAPGSIFSYSNAAFGVLGRLIEVLRAKPYGQCLRDSLLGPLGVDHAANDPYEAILFRAAVGHLQSTPASDPQPASVWATQPAGAAMGSMLAMRPRDLLSFAVAHLNSGVAPNGARVLSSESASLMQQVQIETPGLAVAARGWGIGWAIYDWAGTKVIGHNGDTIGQHSFLRAVPGRNVALAILTNGGNASAVYREVTCHVLREFADVTVPAPLVPPREHAAVDAARHVGRYTARSRDLRVSQDLDGRLWIDSRPSGMFAELNAKTGSRSEVVPLNDHVFIVDGLVTANPDVFAFLGEDSDGRSEYLHTGGRAYRRVGGL